MIEENKALHAKTTYGTLCQAMERNNWSHQKDEGKMSVHCAYRGEDLTVDITVTIDAERQLANLYSRFDFVVPENKRLDMAIAVSAVNNDLVNGVFDYNIAKGYLMFRMVNSIADSVISPKVFEYMIACTSITVDKYNDKFLAICKGTLSVEQFIESLKA